jgi:glycosyltransferase involved in cell wall biosynthesis
MINSKAGRHEDSKHKFVRILYLAGIRFPLERANGIQSMETCYALAQRGHDVTLVVRPDTETPPRDPFAFHGLATHSKLHIEVVPVTGPPLARRAGYLTFAIGRSIGTTRQDVVFTRDLALASLLVALPRALRAPVVYEAHTIAAEAAEARPNLLTGAAAASPAKLRRLEARDRRVWRGADGYVTITDGLRRELERRFGPRPRIAVIPDGVRVANDAEQHPTVTRASSGTFTIGYAGHLYPWKGVDLIVEALAAMPDARALIVGGHDREPDLARVKAFARELDCASRITFTGLIPPSEVADRLREADVLVLPNPRSAISDAHTSPLKLFEYMASGRPIVASDLASIQEVLRDGENAVLVEPGNPQALVAGLRTIRDDPALAQRVAAQAARDVREYTWARRAERLETLLTAVIGAVA